MNVLLRNEVITIEMHEVGCAYYNNRLIKRERSGIMGAVIYFW